MASIPLQIQTPQATSPLQNIGALMQLRNGMSELALRQAQTQAAAANTQNIQAEAQQRQRDLQDQNTIQQVLQDPDAHAKLIQGDISPIAGKVQPKTEFAIQQAAVKAAQDKAALTTTQLTNQTAALGRAADTLAGLQSQKGPDGKPDLGFINANLPNAIAGLQEAGVFKELGIDPSALPKQITDPQQLDSIAAKLGAEKALTDKVLAQKKTAQETTTSAATAAKATADAALAGAQTVQAQQNTKLVAQKIAATDALNQPGALEDIINSRIPAQFPEFRQAALTAARAAAKFNPGDPAKVAEAVEKVAGNADEILKSSNPAEIQAKAAQAGANANATIGPDVLKATAEEKAKAALAGGAVSGILDQSIRNKVVADQIKLNDDKNKALGEAQQLEDYVNAARSGNQAAAGNIPIGALRAIVTRVNRQELERQGGQSWLRRVDDYVAKGVTGAPSAQTLADFEQLANIGKNKAAAVYSGGVQNLNTNYGAKYPIETPTANIPSTGSAYKAGDKRQINGKTYVRDSTGNWNPQ